LKKYLSVEVGNTRPISYEIKINVSFLAVGWIFNWLDGFSSAFNEQDVDKL
jgi:hypothetical protein